MQQTMDRIAKRIAESITNHVNQYTAEHNINIKQQSSSDILMQFRTLISAAPTDTIHIDLRDITTPDSFIRAIDMIVMVNAILEYMGELSGSRIDSIHQNLLSSKKQLEDTIATIRSIKRSVSPEQWTRMAKVRYQFKNDLSKLNSKIMEHRRQIVKMSRKLTERIDKIDPFIDNIIRNMTMDWHWKLYIRENWDQNAVDAFVHENDLDANFKMDKFTDSTIIYKLIHLYPEAAIDIKALIKSKLKHERINRLIVDTAVKVAHATNSTKYRHALIKHSKHKLEYVIGTADNVDQQIHGKDILFTMDISSVNKTKTTVLMAAIPNVSENGGVKCNGTMIRLKNWDQSVVRDIKNMCMRAQI